MPIMPIPTQEEAQAAAEAINSYMARWMDRLSNETRELTGGTSPFQGQKVERLEYIGLVTSSFYTPGTPIWKVRFAQSAHLPDLLFGISPDSGKASLAIGYDFDIEKSS